MEPIRSLKKGAAAAKEFGSEAEANNLGMFQYKDDIAFYYGKSNWSEMNQEEKNEATIEFFNGRQEEKKLRNS